jgi:hypothetical protein
MGRYLDLLVGVETAPQAEVSPRDKSVKSYQRAGNQVLSSLISLLSHADVQPDRHPTGVSPGAGASDTSPFPASAVAAEATEADSGKWSEAEEERAATVEYDGWIPRAWAEGYARLHPDRPPGDVPQKRWQQFVDDVGHFLDHWADYAAALGWGPHELFGCDREKPFARVDEAGLLWLLAGDRLIALSENTATIEKRTGARQTWRRKHSEPGRVLAWELVDDGRPS